MDTFDEESSSPEISVVDQDEEQSEHDISVYSRSGRQGELFEALLGTTSFTQKSDKKLEESYQSPTTNKYRPLGFGAGRLLGSPLVTNDHTKLKLRSPGLYDSPESSPLKVKRLIASPDGKGGFDYPSIEEST